LCFFAGIERVASAADRVYGTIHKHSIDIEMDRMIEDDGSTFGEKEAYQWAVQEWDKLLNENYNALMKKFTKEEQDKLRASQREWIKYRDLEFAFNSTYWSGYSGSMYQVFPLGYKYLFVRERALRLGYYLEDLDDASRIRR
jgi:uncharacterized protein YecT (DUF1311 family)